MATHVPSDAATAFMALLKACAKCKHLHRGMKVHHDLLQKGLLELCLDSLVIMYARCGALSEAEELLHVHKCSNVIAWTNLIAAYTYKGQARDALNCFRRMQQGNLSPDAVILVCVLKACSIIRATDVGKEIHAEIAKQGLLEDNVVVGTALIDMYATCGALLKSRQVLDELRVRNLFSWNALITGFAQHGEGAQALLCFEQMQCEGFSPDKVTFLSALAACGSLQVADKGEQIHNEIVRRGLFRRHVKLGNAVVHMYVRCWALGKAQQVLDDLPTRNVVSWSALIAGYAQQGHGEHALDCYKRMRREGFFPNDVTFVCVLKACGSIAAVDEGEEIHNEIARQGLLEDHVELGNALVDMYAKCGALAEAQQVLEELPLQDVISWNTLVAGYTQHDQGEQALSCFERMQQVGFRPDAVTLMYILRACARIGLIENMETYFANLSIRFGIKPHAEHYCGMIDALGHAGLIDKAAGVIGKVSLFDFYVQIWSALLHSCHALGEVEVGIWAFQMRQQTVSVRLRQGADMAKDTKINLIFDI